MKLRYLGPTGRRRIDGKRLRTGQTVDVNGGETAVFLLSRRLNDGKPEFESAEETLTITYDPERMTAGAGEEEE